jgi:drug/metabolite transporter (DMT)-like permease
MIGITLGLMTALAWGVTDSLAAVSSRRLGALQTAAASLLVSVIVLGAAVIVTGWVSIGGDTLVRILALGAVATVANLALWQALRIAPLSIVSPIGATVGVATVVLAMLLLGERPAPLQLVAVPIAAAGSVVAALVPSSRRGRPALTGGALLAFVAVLGYAVIGVGLRDPIREVGWLPVAFLNRTTNALLTWSLLMAFLAFRRRAPAEAGPTVSTIPIAAHDPAAAAAAPAPQRRYGDLAPGALVGLILLLGLADLAGVIFFSAGLEAAPAWLIGLLASTGPVIGIIVGLTLFGERLRRHQWAGLALVGTGVVLVALAEIRIA